MDTGVSVYTGILLSTDVGELLFKALYKLGVALIFECLLCLVLNCCIFSNIGDKKGLQMALGNLDPNTLEQIDNFCPDKPLPKVTKIIMFRLGMS